MSRREHHASLFDVTGMETWCVLLLAQLSAGTEGVVRQCTFFALQKQHKIENANKDLILPVGADISCGLRGGVG